jgi:hypothetical protein
MARKQIRIEDVLEFAATPRGRSTVFWSAISFAVCHLIVMTTEQTGAYSTDSLEQQLIHFGAELCRFVLPVAVMLIGLSSYVASKFRGSASGIRPRSP